MRRNEKNSFRYSNVYVCSLFDVSYFNKYLSVDVHVKQHFFLDDGIVHVVGLLVVVCDVHDVCLLALLLWSWLRFRWLFFGNCWLSSCCWMSVVDVLLVMSASLSELMESSSDD